LPVPYGYTGYRHEQALGLIDARGRFYDPKFGVFLSADPVGPLSGSSIFGNRYAYVGYDPVNRTDPTGYYAYDGGISGALAIVGEIVGAVVVAAVVVALVWNAVDRASFLRFTAWVGNGFQNPESGGTVSSMGVSSGSGPSSGPQESEPEAEAEESNGTFAVTKAVGAPRPGSRGGQLFAPYRPERTGPDERIACYPACSLNPRGDFATQEQWQAYRAGGDIVQAVLLTFQGAASLARVGARLFGAARGATIAESASSAAAQYPKQVAQALRMNPQQLQKSITSFTDNIAKHQGYLKNPQSHVPNWSQLSQQHNRT
jgi:RHS repeat-associated protein